VPRPDLSVTTGAPNACDNCHGSQSALWAADRLREWLGRNPVGFQKYAFTQGDGRTRDHLTKLLQEKGQPAMARATAAALAAPASGSAGLDGIKAALADASALVRRGALDSLEQHVPEEERVSLAAPLLDDPVRIVRIEAARLLAASPPERLTPSQREAYARAAGEYEAAERLNADRPEHRTNLGSYLAQRGRYLEAEAEFVAARKLLPTYVPAIANLADLRRVQGRDADAEAVLRDGLKSLPDAAVLHHALGLTLVRMDRTGEALESLANAARLEPGNPIFAYVHGIALHSTGQTRKALEVIERALTEHEADYELLMAAVTINRDWGDRQRAQHWLERLAGIAPEDPTVQALLSELEN
jgi:Flp pilus assembly protein TadD